MTQFAGHDAVVSIDSTDGGSLVDYSSDIKSVNLRGNYNGAVYHTIDGVDAKALVGGRSFTVEITLVNDNTASELAGVLRAWLLAATKAGARSMQIKMPDGSTGSLQLDFEIKPGGNFDLAAIVAGAGESHDLTVTFNVDGAITPSTIS